MINFKYIITAAALLHLSKVKAQVTTIPDPIFEQYLIDFGMDSDQTINGQVLTSDIDNRTFLQINESPPFYFINDFTGIQDFAALETFFFVGTNVIDLDFGNLDNLVYVEGISNTDLALIDLSACDNLETFIMSNTSLITLNLPLTVTLDLFECDDGLLESIDLSPYINLTRIRVTDNMLTNLNMASGNNMIIEDFFASGNPNLQCIIVDDTDYSSANWTNIDSTTTFVESQAECDALSIEEFNFIELHMYPNPTNDFFQINTDAEISKIDIIDLTGKIVKSFKSQRDGYSTSKLSEGLYIINIQTSKGEISRKLIIH